MTEDFKEMKKQRDRFLAFAFASADLLLEINAKNEIQFASGAARGFTGDVSASLVGTSWLELFTVDDRVLALSLRNQTAAGKRCGPILVNMNTQYSSVPVGILTGMKLPDYPELFFVTISQGSILTGRVAGQGRTESQNRMLDKESFAMAAVDAMATAKLMGRELDVTFLDIPGTEGMQNKLAGEDWDDFKMQLAAVLKSKSVDGQMAAEFEDGRYGLLHDKNIAIGDLQKEISDLSKSKDPDGKGLEVTTQTVEANNEGLTEREFAKALVYTINKFEEQGNQLTISSLNSGFESFLKENAEKINELKSVINQQRFNFAFQPIVDLKTGDAHHFEALIRFESKKSPYEMIIFGEDVGLAPEIDIMVCSKALNYIIYNMAHNKSSLAVNISGLSIQSEPFVKALRDKLQPHIKARDIAKRLMFEITESSQIKDLDRVNHFVQMLRKDGFQVWLDDFGAGAASFQYLQKLQVDGVKINGQYIDGVLASDRDGKLVKNLVNMCRDMGMKTVAERVETPQQAKFLKDINVDYGQGYLFARPGDKPEYFSKIRK